ncbi:MAG TPA: DUF1553 domain-containing protein, partial [Pirellulales bacterium]
FWGLNAFFKQMHVERLDASEDGAVVKLTDVDFVSSLGDSTEAETYYETRQGLLQVAYPTFLDGRKINPSGEVSVVNRRDELAKLVIGSTWAKTAAVNRLWGHFLGFGLVHPVDDFGPHNPASHPTILNLLGDAFADTGWDLRRAMKWIVLSRPYQLSSRIDPHNRVDLPEAGETPLFTRFYLRQMRAEALFESLVVATKMDRDLPHDFSARQGRQQAWMQQFVIDFNTDENDETVTFDGSITQSLMMMNGDLMAQATSIEPGSFLNLVATAPTSDREKISELYLAALGRQPNSQEVQLAQQLWSARRGDAQGTLQDVWWALLNSNEFIMNH